MSIRTNAKSIGTKDAQSETLVAAIRKAWLKASAERKAEIRFDFMVGYMAGREKISLSAAEAVIAEGKVNAKNTGMIDRASSAFNYRIMQGKAKPEAPQKSTRIQAHVREAATAFLAEFKGETLAEQITQAIKVLQAMR